MLRKLFPGIIAHTLIMLLALVGLSLFTGVAQAAPKPAPDKADVIIIGDRLVDIAFNLGVVPAAMSVRASFWPMYKSLNTASSFLGCPNCLTKKKCAPLLKFAKKNGIRQVIIEKGDPFCIYMPDLKPENLAALIKDAGLKVDIIEYTGDLGATVRETARLLGRENRVAELMKTYEAQLKKTMDSLTGNTVTRNVVIINGVSQKSSGKTFLRIEAPGGYADQYLLSKLGCKNTGNLMAKPGASVSKGHIAIRKLDGLMAAAPDVIITTGDAPAVQRALCDAVKNNPALSKIPALKDHAVFSLPGFINSSVIEYPMILRQWKNTVGSNLD